MRYRKLPQEVRQQITEYYEHRYRRKFFNEEAILNGLSQGLKEVRKSGFYLEHFFWGEKFYQRPCIPTPGLKLVGFQHLAYNMVQHISTSTRKFGDEIVVSGREVSLSNCRMSFVNY